MKSKSEFTITCAIALAVLLTGLDCEDPWALWNQQTKDKIVFTSKADDENGELYVLEGQGTITRLSTNDQHENNVALSRDGTKIAYNSGDPSDMLTWETPQLRARSSPLSFKIRAETTQSSSRPIVRMSSSVSAICGTTCGWTKEPT